MLNIGESKKTEQDIDPVSQVNAYQDATVFIPVEITPHADSGAIKTSCCGEVTTSFHKDPSSDKYRLIVIQPVRVEIPLEFGAEALIGKLHVQFGERTEHGEECSIKFETEPHKPNLSMIRNGYKTFY